MYHISFKHHKHNIIGQAFVATADLKQAIEKFKEYFEARVFSKEGFFEGKFGSVQATFWEGVDFEIKPSAGTVHNFAWDKADRTAVNVFVF